MKRFLKDEITKLEHLYKINLINSCSGFKSANLIGTMANDGTTNVSVFSSIQHLGSEPALLGMIFRPLTVARNTYDNIKETGYYTINHIYEEICEDAHHTSAKYPKEFSEFNATSLIPHYIDGYKPPFVKGSPVQLLMKYVEEYHIKANGTIMLIGEIIQLFVEEALLETDGFVDLSKGKIATINGLDAYAIPSDIKRYDYQRPKKELIQ